MSAATAWRDGVDSERHGRVVLACGDGVVVCTHAKEYAVGTRQYAIDATRTQKPRRSAAARPGTIAGA